jgi:hypothetical protein
VGAPAGKEGGLRTPKAALVSVALFAVLSAATVSAVSAQGQNNNHDQNGDLHSNKPDPLFSATPELDSLVLFGSGIAGVLGYAALRRRARR